MPDKIHVNIEDFYLPHINQIPIHKSEARIKVLKCGRRWGKSRAAVIELLRAYYGLVQENRPSSLIPKVHIWIVAPQYHQARQAWSELKAFIHPDLVEHKSEDEKTLRLSGDCLIEVKSADNPETLQTVGLDFIWVTEAANIKDEVWYGQIVPMLRSPGRAGRAIIESRPRRKNCWFEDKYKEGLQGDAYIQSFHFTTKDNPYVDWDAILREDKPNMPDSFFAQEYLAETQADESRAFRNIENCIGGELLEEPEKGAEYVMGLDWGRHPNFTVITVLDKYRRRVVHWERLGTYTYTTQKAVVFGTANRWNKAKIYADASAMGEILVEDLRLEGLRIEGIKFTGGLHGTKMAIMQGLSVAMEQETVRFPKIPELINELEDMRMEQAEAGYMRYYAPVGRHDDCVDSLALALYGCPRAGAGELLGNFPKAIKRLPLPEGVAGNYVGVGRWVKS